MSSSRKTASFEEIAYSNMLVIEALVEQLSRKGAIDRDRLTARIKELRGETQISPAVPNPEQVMVGRTDLIAANNFVLELLPDLLFGKGFLTLEEIAELKMKLTERVKALHRSQ